MTTYPSVRDLLARYGLHAKKSWGQNFLVEERAYEAIVRAADLGPGQLAVEIGAGLGTLSARLLATGAQVVAVERERDMCHVLRSELSTHDHFDLREENALHLDLSTLCQEKAVPDLVLVGNLPYQIATPLLFHFLSFAPILRRLVLMFQREVADRLLAAPNTDAYSALSAQVQMVAEVRRVCHVGKGGFSPPPKVDSSVVLVTPRKGTKVPVRDLRCYQQVVRAAFGQRRKTLRNALQACFGDAVESALALASIDGMRRGETLSIEDFARLADALVDLAPRTTATEEPADA